MAGHAVTHVAAPTRTRVLVLAGAVPQRSPRTAGARYVSELVGALSTDADVITLAPSHPDNLAAVRENRVLGTVLLVPPSMPGRLLGRLEGAGRRLDLALPPFEVALALARDPRAREAVRAADVIDLQWQEFVSLAPLLRRLNPRARLVGTWHDALSQLAVRTAAHPAVRAARVRTTRWHERRSTRWVDTPLTLNDKDSALLGEGGVRPDVMDPPLGGSAPARAPVHPPVVLMVASFARAVNADGAAWFVDHAWPEVRQRFPAATLRLVGPDPDGRLDSLVSVAGVERVGFVSDLDAEYAAATVAVVPLLSGSGVKFKTIEAAVADVPVVATTVGAEGIEPRLLTAVCDDAEDFAAAVAAVLAEPASAARRAAEGGALARERYGRDRFVERVRSVYGLAAPSEASQPVPGPSLAMLDTRPVLIVSPHLDDAVFSCSALLQRRADAEVVTVCTGAPVTPVSRSWDVRCGFADSDEAVAARLAEEAAALAGRMHVDRLGLLDAQYLDAPRTADDTLVVREHVTRWLDEHPDGVVAVPVGAGLPYTPMEPPSNTTTRGRALRRVAGPLGKRVFHAVRRRRQASATGGLAIVNSDHAWVRDTILDALADPAHASVLLYEDYPYLQSRPGDEAAMATATRLGRLPQLVRGDLDVERKLEAMRCYASQIREDPALCGHVALAPVERYWFFPKEAAVEPARVS